MRRGDMGKKPTAVHDKREPIHQYPTGMAIGRVENNDRILRLVMERSIASGWDEKTS